MRGARTDHGVCYRTSKTRPETRTATVSLTHVPLEYHWTIEFKVGRHDSNIYQEVIELLLAEDARRMSLQGSRLGSGQPSTHYVGNDIEVPLADCLDTLPQREHRADNRPSARSIDKMEDLVQAYAEHSFNLKEHAQTIDPQATAPVEGQHVKRPI